MLSSLSMDLEWMHTLISWRPSRSPPKKSTKSCSESPRERKIQAPVKPTFLSLYASVHSHQQKKKKQKNQCTSVKPTLMKIERVGAFPWVAQNQSFRSRGHRLNRRVLEWTHWLIPNRRLKQDALTGWSDGWEDEHRLISTEKYFQRARRNTLIG